MWVSARRMHVPPIRWYIGAWVVYVITVIALVMSARAAGAQGSGSPSPTMTIAIAGPEDADLLVTRPTTPG
jgi:hypothetical protein